MALLDHHRWVEGLLGLAVVAYSFYLRSLWRRYRERGTVAGPPRSHHPARFEEGADRITDARVAFFGPYWAVFTLVGVGVLAHYFSILIK